MQVTLIKTPKVFVLDWVSHTWFKFKWNLNWSKTILVMLCCCTLCSRRGKSCEVMKFFNFLGSKRFPNYLCQYYSTAMYSVGLSSCIIIFVFTLEFLKFGLLDSLCSAKDKQQQPAYVCSFPLDELSHFLLQFVNSLSFA